MVNISFVCSTSGRDSKGLLEQFRYLTPHNSGIWKNIKGVEDITKADYYVVLEEFNKGFLNNFDMSKVIYFQAEPFGLRKKCFAKKFKDTFYRYFDYNNYYFPPFWSTRIPYDNLYAEEYPDKSKNFSCIMSTKNNSRFIGYQKRIDFLQQIEIITNDIDIYGRGREKELSYKDTCPRLAYIDYKYTLSCENCSMNGHATDRIYDSIVNWCVPIYWGMKDIERLCLPSEAYRLIDIEKDDPSKVLDYVSEPIDKVTHEALCFSKHHIMDNLNFWNKIYEVLNE